MNTINERISWLENEIKNLSKIKSNENEEAELKRLISICDYDQELMNLKLLQKANANLS